MPLLAKCLFRVFHHGCLIAQVVHVAVKLCAAPHVGTYAHYHYQQEQTYRPAIAIHRITVDAVDDFEGFVLLCFPLLATTEQEGEEGQREECGSCYGKCGKESEVLQQVGAGEEETAKGTDGGYAP